MKLSLFFPFSREKLQKKLFRAADAIRGLPIEALEHRVLLTAAGYSPANIIAYFPDYRFSSAWPDTSLTGLSEINYFSITPNNDGSLPSSSTSGYGFSQLQTIVSAAHAASPRVAVSIVIDPATAFLTIAQSPTASANFISNLISFSSTFNLDGIDLDYEPGTLTTAQKNSFGNLLAGLHNQTSAHGLILSAAVQASQLIIPQAYLNDIDRYNLMDYALEYNSSAPYSDSISYLTNWTNYGVPRAKLIMGVPFYASSGSSWSNSTAETYGQIASAYAAANGGVYPAANLDSVTISGTTWGYNGITTLTNKANYVLQNGYGGMMIWELGQDHFSNGTYDSHSLLPAIKTAMAGTPSTVVNANTMMINTATGGGATTLSESGGTFTISSPAGTYTASSSAVNSILITGSGGADTLNITSTLDKPLSFVGQGAGRDVVNVVSGTITLLAPATGAGVLPEALGTLSIAGGASVLLLDASSHSDRTLLMVNSLLFAGSTNVWAGQMDLQWNDFLIHNGSLATVTNQLATGFNAGGLLWSGLGIISSTANATNRTALGVTSGLTTFDGNPVAKTDIAIKYTYYGDANLDGKVDASDYSLIDSGFITHATGWFNGDFNEDGILNGSDYTLIDNAFDTQGGNLTAQVAPVHSESTNTMSARWTSNSAQSPAVVSDWNVENIASQIYLSDLRRALKHIRFSAQPILLT